MTVFSSAVIGRGAGWVAMVCLLCDVSDRPLVRLPTFLEMALTTL